MDGQVNTIAAMLRSSGINPDVKGEFNKEYMVCALEEYLNDGVAHGSILRGSTSEEIELSRNRYLELEIYGTEQQREFAKAFKKGFNYSLFN